MSTTVPNPVALTVATTARRLNVSEKTVYRAVARGELAAVRVGRSIRISESTLEHLLNPPKETS